MPQNIGTIHVVNIHTTDCSMMPNYYYIGRSKENNILGNPFTFDGNNSSLAKLSFRTRDEAIKAYEVYFRKMYGNNESFTRKIDEIYEHYKNGEDIYLGCFCNPLPCHGDIIAKEMQKRFIKEKMTELKSKRKDFPSMSQ